MSQEELDSFNTPEQFQKPEMFPTRSQDMSTPYEGEAPGFFTSADDASITDAIGASFKRRGQNTLAAFTTDPQASRYQKRRAQRANQEFNDEMSKLSTVGQLAAGAADIAPVFAATALTRNPWAGAATMGGFTSADTLSQQLDSTGEYDLGSAAAAGTASAGFDLMTGGMANKVVGNIAQNLSRPSVKVAQELGTMGGQGAVSNMGSQVFMNLGSDRPWYENVPEAGASGFAAGGAIHGGTMGYNKLSGTSKALNYGANEAGTESINRTAKLNEEGFNLPNDVIDNVAEFNNINKARTDEIMNANFSDDVTGSLSSLSDVSVNHGTGTAITNALEVLQNNGFPLTAKGLDVNFGTGYGKEGNYNLAELLGYDRAGIEKAGEHLNQLVPTRSSRKTGLSPERQKLEMKESYESGFNQITSPIRDGLSNLYKIKRENQLSGGNQNSKLVDIAINSLEDLNKRIPSMLDGKSMPTKEELASIDFNVRRSLSEIGELGNMKGLDGVKGNFNPANILETLGLYHKMVTNQYPQVTYGTPDPAKEGGKFWQATPESVGVDAVLAATTGLPLVTATKSLARVAKGKGRERLYKKSLRDAGESAAQWASQVARRSQEIEANKVINKGVESGDSRAGAVEAQADLESMGITTDTTAPVITESPVEVATARPESIQESPASSSVPDQPSSPQYGSRDLDARARFGAREDKTGLDSLDPSVVEKARKNLSEEEKGELDSLGWKHRSFLEGSSDSMPTQSEYSRISELLNKGSSVKPEPEPAKTSDFAGKAASKPKKTEKKTEETKTVEEPKEKSTPPDLASKPKKVEPKQEETKPSEESQSLKSDKADEVKTEEVKPSDEVESKTKTDAKDMASKPKKAKVEEDSTAPKEDEKQLRKESDSSKLSRKPEQKSQEKHDEVKTEETKKEESTTKEEVVETDTTPKEETTDKPKVNARSLVHKPIQDKIAKVNKPHSQMTTQLSNEFRKLSQMKRDVDDAVSGYASESRNNLSKDEVYQAIHEMGGVEKMMSDSPNSTMSTALNKLMRNYDKKVADAANESANSVQEYTAKELEAMKHKEEAEIISNATNKLKAQGVEDSTISEAISRAKEELGSDINPNLIIGYAKTIAKDKSDTAKAELKAAEKKKSKAISDSAKTLTKSLADSKRDLYNYADRLGLVKESRIRDMIDNATRWHGDSKKAKGLSEASERAILNKMHDHIKKELEAYENALKSPDTDQIVDVAKWKEASKKARKRLEVFDQIAKQADKKASDKASKAKVGSDKIEKSEAEIKKLSDKISELERAVEKINKIPNESFKSKSVEDSISKITNVIKKELDSSRPQEVVEVAGKISSDMSGYFDSVDSPKFKLYQEGMSVISDKLEAVGKMREAKAVRATSDIIKKAIQTKAEFPDNKDLWISVEDRNKISKTLSDDTSVSAWYGNLYQKLRSSVFGTENSKQFIVNSRDKIESDKKKIKARRVAEEQSRKDPGEDGIFAPGIK